jgi:hypothetical protein
MDEVRFDLARQLGIHDLIGVLTEPRLTGNPTEEVSDTPPATIEQGRLVDQIDAFSHGVIGRRRPRFESGSISGPRESRQIDEPCRVGS